MENSQSTPLRRSPLHGVHQDAGAHFTEFGGWEMPVKYASELTEHHAVRGKAGLFDLSHMGEIWVAGPGAGDFLNYALAGNFTTLAVGRARYSLMLATDGTVIDDLITYRTGEEKYLVVPNASNAATVSQELASRSAGFKVLITDVSLDTALLAIQGPKAPDILAQALPEDQREALGELKYYAIMHAEVANTPAWVARTGYTGEDGFEIYVPKARGVELWNALMEIGGDDLTPCGLAARDSLRLEAGMPLYGHELGREINPYMANLGPVISWKKECDFVGKDALTSIRSQRETEGDQARVLVGLKGATRRSARAGYEIMHDGDVIGEVTSGLPSPTLEYPIALGFVPVKYAEPGTAVEVNVRGKSVPFEICQTPFYKRQK